MENNKDSILLAGGRGFIGGHIAKALINQGIPVISIDSGLFEPSLAFQKISNSNLLTNLTGDVSDYNFISKINFKGKLKAIINCVGPARPSYFYKNPVYTAKTLTESTINLLKIAHRNKTTYIHASSSEIYGNLSVDSIEETMLGQVNTISLRAAYSEAKRFSETIVASYFYQYNLPTIILRLFNVYGPEFAIDDDRVVAAFIKAALMKKPLYIHGSGNQIRSFCFIDDVVSAFMKALQFPSFLCVNIGNPEPISIINLANLIEEIIKQKLTIKKIDKRKDDIPRRVPNISKAKIALNWFPTIGLREGLCYTIEQFKLTKEFYERY